MISQAVTKDAEILLVDDNPDDIEITLASLGKIRLSNKIHVVNNGVEALAFLRKQSPYTNAPQPDLIFLDINMPIKDGNETLKEIKEDLALRLIPVIMLTSSYTEENIFRSFESSANCVLHKPLDLDQIKRVIRLFDNFSLKLMVTPY